MRIEVLEGDAITSCADVLVLKYAQGRHGVDEVVACRLREAGARDDDMIPQRDSFSLVHGLQQLGAPRILFIGVGRLWEFGYEEIRFFARRALAILSKEQPDARSVLTTVHGPSYGLDETEAFECLVAGFLDAAQSGDVPAKLEVIRVVERDKQRAARLQRALQRVLPTDTMDRGPRRVAQTRAANERLKSAGYASAAKPHVFVAMPFADEMEDVFHYGIQNAVHALGWLCERADMSAFTGDVMHWVTNRIKTASLVIADLTAANPNVYLEVGLAWGCGVPAVLLVRDAKDLRFDVRGQRCLVYKTIKDLETKLCSELRALPTRAAI
jgi:hypothetical protein